MNSKINLGITGHIKITNQLGVTKWEDHNDIDPTISKQVVACRLVGGVFSGNNGITKLEFNYGANITGFVDITSYAVTDNELTLTTIITDEQFTGLLNHLYLKTPSLGTFSSRENVGITKEAGETLYVTWKLIFNI